MSALDPGTRRMLVQRATRAAGGDEQLAEDAVQEALIAWLAHRDHLREDCRAWLTVVACRRAIDLKRRRAREICRGDQLAIDATDPAPGPEQLAISGAERDRLVRALLELGPRDREVLLTIADGLPLIRLTDRDGQNKSTGSRRLTKARERARRALGASC